MAWQYLQVKKHFFQEQNLILMPASKSAHTKPRQQPQVVLGRNRKLSLLQSCKRSLKYPYTLQHLSKAFTLNLFVFHQLPIFPTQFFGIRLAIIHQPRNRDAQIRIWFNLRNGFPHHAVIITAIGHNIIIPITQRITLHLAIIKIAEIIQRFVRRTEEQLLM